MNDVYWAFGFHVVLAQFEVSVLDVDNSYFGYEDFE